MNNIKYHLQIGVSVACTMIMTPATNKIGQRYMKGAIKDCFVLDSFFSSNNLVEAAMDVGAENDGMVKTNKNDFSWRPLILLQIIGQEVLTLC